MRWMAMVFFLAVAGCADDPAAELWPPPGYCCHVDEVCGECTLVPVDCPAGNKIGWTGELPCGSGEGFWWLDCDTECTSVEEDPNHVPPPI